MSICLFKVLEGGYVFFKMSLKDFYIYAIITITKRTNIMKVGNMRFICPNCKEKLHILDNRAVCSRGHSFDRARGGYYNLLLSNTGGAHGDNKEMVLARRSFLADGFYLPLASHLAERALSVTPHGGLLLDAGAGEGYYTDIIERALFQRDGKSDVSAFDISKAAVREIHRKNPRITTAVAGSYHMPVTDCEFDTVINTFSPLALSETLRVIKQGGAFIMAIPGEMHLFELKSVIYDTPYKNTVADPTLQGFELIEDKPITYKMQLDTPERVNNLFMMTPYAYRTKPDDKKKVKSLKNLECTADFRTFVYKKL